MRCGSHQASFALHASNFTLKHCFTGSDTAMASWPTSRSTTLLLLLLLALHLQACHTGLLKLTVQQLPRQQYAQSYCRCCSARSHHPIQQCTVLLTYCCCRSSDPVLAAAAGYVCAGAFATAGSLAAARGHSSLCHEQRFVNAVAAAALEAHLSADAMT